MAVLGSAIICQICVGLLTALKTQIAPIFADDN